MESILKKILIEKKKEVTQAKKNFPLKILRAQIKSQTPCPCRDFKKSISSPEKVSIIGELKKASPSKGFLNKGLELAKTAVLYKEAGVSAISVLTDKHFLGELCDIKKIKTAVRLPVLRKDFIIDEYQLYESYFAGADAVLLIASVLNKNELSRMLRIISNLGMSALIEVHDESDLTKINFKEAQIIGINNRNLNDFTVDMTTTERLIKKIPKDKIIVSESGICSREDVLYLKKLGVNAVLIGEGIVTAKDIRLKIRSLLGKC